MQNTPKNPKFPIGRFQPPTTVTATDITNWIQEIKVLPQQMKAAIDGMTEAQLNTPYRPEGWTPRQVVHHVADSHMNAYIRFKLALTETEPTVKPYAEHLWAELPDTAETPIEISLQLLEALHQRWAILCQHCRPSDWQKVFLHPEHGTRFQLDRILAEYVWHGKHHLGHINLVKNFGS